MSNETPEPQPAPPPTSDPTPPSVPQTSRVADPADIPISWTQERKMALLIGAGSGLIASIVVVITVVFLGLGRSQAPAPMPAANPSTQLPNIPVQMQPGTRKSGNGDVIHFINTAPASLSTVMIMIESPNNVSKVVSRDSWPTGEAVTIGDEDGWIFSPGQRITIMAPGYLPLRVTLQSNKP